MRGRYRLTATDPAWVQPPEGSDLGGNQMSHREGDSTKGLALLRRRLREAFISIRPILLS